MKTRWMTGPASAPGDVPLHERVDVPDRDALADRLVARRVVAEASVQNQPLSSRNVAPCDSWTSWRTERTVSVTAGPLCAADITG